MAVEDIFLGRQPILDRSQRLVAYELLFRAGHDNVSNVTDDLHATASVITHAFGEFGVQSVLGPHLGFINVSAEMLHSDLIELLPKDQVVLELLETVEVTDALVARCRELKGEGFRLALDDFVFDEAFVPLLQLVDIVKIDLQLHAREELPGIVSQLKRWPVRLLAEKVDRAEQAAYCRELGFELFQGYFFARPAVLSSRRPDAATLHVLKLLDLVLSDAGAEEIEDAFKHAPGLTYNLMRLVNSVAAGMRAKIGSIHRAVVVLGRRQLQRWLQLLLFTTQPHTEFSSPLLQMAAGRAKLMELLAVRVQDDRNFADSAFMTGILSLLDALLEMPIDEVVARLNLDDEVVAALLRHEGDLGRLLALARCVEQADRLTAESLLATFARIDIKDLMQAELEAFAWANEIT